MYGVTCHVCAGNFGTLIKVALLLFNGLVLHASPLERGVFEWLVFML